MKVILVPVADRPECARALRTAFDLGQRLDASVAGCHIRAHSHSSVSLPRSLLEGEAAWQQAISKKPGTKSAAAKKLFGEVAEKHGYDMIRRPRKTSGALWQEKVGSPHHLMSIVGPVSDLVVVSRPASKGGELAEMFLRAALLNTGKPVLVMPQVATRLVGRRVCIAWNQSIEAAQAVAAAMPLLTSADEVNIISSGSTDALGPKANQLENYLKFWGVNPNCIQARGTDHTSNLLEGYKETKSDLLIMGAYSRSRLRERIFGGVTDHMLRRANIPVLMLHS